jgi:hypothetical protein
VLDLSYLELQRMSDSVQKHALRRYSKGHYLRELPDGALEAFLGRGACPGSGGGDFLPNAVQPPRCRGGVRRRDELG